MRKVCLYARVSSKEQEREGFSIPAQLKLLRDYAASKSFEISAEFTDVETAGKAGRRGYDAMIALLRKSKERIILAEKTDRIYRNFKDYVIFEELGAEIHFVKEGSILSPDSRSHDKFIHEIKVVMAKNYLDNLKEETQKGMREKAEQGLYPSTAPRGYRNGLLPDGRRGLLVHPAQAAEVIAVFETYATGDYSLASLPGPAWARPNYLKKMLDNPIYYGEFIWRRVRYQGVHEPLISRQLWEQCQQIMKRNRRGNKIERRSFPFSGLITCGWCNGLLVGRLHKGRYVYYHCRNPLSVCTEPYIRQEEIERQYNGFIQRLRFTPEVVADIKRALVESASDKERHYAEETKSLRMEFDRLQNRLEQSYLDRLDGHIGTEQYTRLSSAWRKRQDEIAARLDNLKETDRNYIDDGLMILEICQYACDAFSVQTPEEKRRMIEVVCLNSRWKAQVLEITWRKPFDLLASASVISSSVPKGMMFEPLVSGLLYPDEATIATYNMMRKAA